MKSELKQQILNLNWNKPKDVQQRAIDLLCSQVTEDDVVYLAKQSNDLCSKPCWHNAAIVLKNIGYPRNKNSLPFLMEWFEDVNWPGVETVIELLKHIEIDIVLENIKYVVEAVKKEKLQEHQFWLSGLEYLLRDLLESCHPEDKKKVEKVMSEIERLYEILYL